jgi:hypothetical protein
MHPILATLLLLLAFAEAKAREAGIVHPVATGRTCKQMSSCEDAVILWCGGYSRADADHDGIPCENVCHSRTEVEAIEREIGCKLGK